MVDSKRRLVIHSQCSRVLLCLGFLIALSSTFLFFHPFVKLSAPHRRIETQYAQLQSVRDESVAVSVQEFNSIANVEIDIDLISLVDSMNVLSKQSECSNIPLFVTMASVGSDLYWQLIENFEYSLAKFNLTACAVMICVSDQNCIRLCKQSGFRCLNFDYEFFHPNKTLPSAMEQIAELKLLHIPKALKLGVHVVIIDLDVGFLADPRPLVKEFMSSDHDIYVQQDVTFIMHRSVELWRTWFTEPQPNIGLFLCKGNSRTVGMFERAWADYLVVNAMRYARGALGLRWRYIPVSYAVLLDKVYKFTNKTYELGGEAADKIFLKKGISAVHTTCYEQKAKVMGLKAANAFWNPHYYRADRRTLTMKLLHTSQPQLLNDVRSLLYLSRISNRTLILPNVLGRDELDTVELYNGRALWPGFRVLHTGEGGGGEGGRADALGVDIVEPAFYWRVLRDYATEGQVPAPRVLRVPVSASTCTADIATALITDSDVHSYPRIVLDLVEVTSHSNRRTINDNNNKNNAKLVGWAVDSVGAYDSFAVEVTSYVPFPVLLDKPQAQDLHGIPGGAVSYDHKYARAMRQQTRLCAKIFERMKGNRSCFDKCD